MKRFRAVRCATLLVCSVALADTVDNPGPFTQTFDAGTIKIGSQQPPFDIIDLQIQGDVDGDGNVRIPAENVVLPDLHIDTPFGTVTARLVAASDASGTLNPLTGDATINLPLRVNLILPGILPPGCGVGPTDVTLTTGSDDGVHFGVPYNPDPADGSATYVNYTFSVPRSAGCGLFGSFIDGQVGLPSSPGNNYVDGLHGIFDPVFFGS